MQKQLLSPVKPLVDKTGESEIPKVDTEVYVDIVDELSFD